MDFQSDRRDRGNREPAQVEAGRQPTPAAGLDGYLRDLREVEPSEIPPPPMVEPAADPLSSIGQPVPENQDVALMSSILQAQRGFTKEVADLGATLTAAANARLDAWNEGNTAEGALEAAHAFADAADFYVGKSRELVMSCSDQVVSLLKSAGMDLGEFKRLRNVLPSVQPEAPVEGASAYADVGEKIGMARKDLAALRKQLEEGGALQMDDLLSLEKEDPAFAGQALTKQQQFGGRQAFLREMKDEFGIPAGAGYVASRLFAVISDRPEDRPEDRMAFLQGAASLKEMIRSWHCLGDVLNDLNQIDWTMKGLYLSLEDQASLETLRKEKVKAWQRVAEGLRDGTIKMNGSWSSQERSLTTFYEHAPESIYAYKRAADAYREAYDAALRRAQVEQLGQRLIWASLGPDFARQVQNGSRRRSMVERSIRIKDDDWSWGIREIEAKATESKQPKRSSEEETPHVPRFQWVRQVPEVVEREGGRAITFHSDSLMETFGFRGVEYGNWMDPEASREHTQAAGEALQDLAEILGIGNRQIGLGGHLALAFGARGSGRFNAHFEPARTVVNLTKTRGGGSLAHECGHGIDNHMAKASVGFKSHHLSFATGEAWTLPGQDLDPQVQEAFSRLQKAIYKGDRVPTEEYTAEPQDPPRFRSFKVLNDLLSKHAGDPGKVMESYMALMRDMKTRAERGDKRSMVAYNKRLRSVAEYVADATKAPVQVRVIRGGGGSSDYLLTAKAKGDYWARPQELFARAFEAYVYDQLKANGRKNTYLVAGCGEEHAEAYAEVNQILEGMGGVTSIYPRGEERVRINQAMAELMETLVSTGFFEAKDAKEA